MVICPDCGKEVKDAKFCSNCGSRLPEVEEIAADVPVEETIEIPAEVVDEPAIEENDVEEVVEVEDVIDDVPEEAVDEKAADDVPEDIVVDEPINAGGKSKFCANCGTEVNEGTSFCPKCGFKLTQEGNSQTKFCQSCGKKINIDAEICPYCGVRVAGIARSEEKSVLLAAILSFLFPGLGQIYNGQTHKAITFIIAYIVSAVLVMILIGVVLVLIVWIWSLVDVIKSTEAINRGEHVEDKLF